MNKDEDMFQLERYCSLKEFDNAINYLEKMITSNCSHFEEALVYLVYLLNENQVVTENACRLFQKGVELFKNNYKLQSEFCRHLFMRGFQKRALDLCKQLTNKFPFSTEVWYILSDFYSEIGDYENAIEAINYAITCSQDDDCGGISYELLFLKALLLYKNGSYHPAIHCFTELMSYKEYDKVIVDHFIAECYMLLNDYESAYQYLNGIIALKDKDDEVVFYGNFIWCCLKTNRQVVAADLLSEALKKNLNTILEHLTILNMVFNSQPETDIGIERIVNPNDLAKLYFTNQAYFN